MNAKLLLSFKKSICYYVAAKLLFDVFLLGKFTNVVHFKTTPNR